MRSFIAGVQALAAAITVAALAAGSAEARTLIGVGIAGSDDHVYYWYSDDRVTSGTSGDPTAYRDDYLFSHSDFGVLRGVDITQGDRVYYWWQRANGQMTVSIGTSANAAAHGVDYHSFQEPNGYTLVTAGVAKSNDHVYYYWRHNPTGQLVVSSGSSVQPCTHFCMVPLQAATTLISYDLMDIAIASNDHVYYWWRKKADGVITVTSGTSTDPFAYRPNHYSSGQ